jgi:hypothetical protein
MGGVRVLIAKKKWDKGKGIIRDLMLWTKQSRWLDRKELKRGRGFSIYLSRTYPPMTSFLLGLHQSSSPKVFTKPLMDGGLTAMKMDGRCNKPRLWRQKVMRMWPR